MKKKLLSFLLALTMCLGLLPAVASAAETETLPDWYFLFAIFKNLDADVKDRDGNVTHQTYTMPQEEIDLNRDIAVEFEEYMNSIGVIRAHVDVVVIDTPVTELRDRVGGDGSFLDAERAAPLLETKVDLDRYDHVTCILDLNVSTGYAGTTPSPFENGTGISCNNHKNWEYIREYYQYRTDNNLWHVQLYSHEFIHFMEYLSRKWGVNFDGHGIGGNFYAPTQDEWKTCHTDTFLNRAKGDAETGTGVAPVAWQYPPHVLRTMTELTVPSSVTSIGERAFRNCTSLSRVNIHSGVTAIGGAAFEQCTALTEFTIPSGVTSIGIWTFQGCTALTRISIPASVTSIGDVAFWKTGLKDVYYGGTETQWKAIEISDYNGPLTNANIYYNSLMADVKTTDWFAQPVAWALANGVTNGTGGGSFSPNITCNQAQILTFLWRAKGQPAPSGAVSGIEFYASAVQWAKEQGLISGSFSPDTPCTRTDVVTYLWKLAGSPAAGTANFSDVPANAACAQAVAWAVAQGVTNGTGNGQFSPDAACTRGQIVTFLYRALA